MSGGRGVAISLLSLLLLWTSPAPGEEPSRDTLLRRTIPGLAETLGGLPPFVRDTQVNLRLRSFYFNRQNSDLTANEAWAFGGWLEYKSGWLADTFAVGAVGYTAQPLYAPSDRDGTTLLAAGQESILVLGQAYAQVRYKDYALLTGYRQAVNDGYVNAQDNRMIPNTFEGVTLAGTVGPLRYDAGYVTRMKARNADGFEAMSVVAGVKNEERGLVLASATLAPVKGLTVYAGTDVVPDVFNTAFAYAEYVHPLTTDLSLTLGVQYTDQRSVGDALLSEFATFNAGARVGILWRGLDLSVRAHATDAGAALRTPYGIWPGYLSLIEKDFDRAREKAWGVRAQYDFGRLGAHGLSVLLFFARGVDARDTVKRQGLPDVNEGDIDIIYDVPWAKGLQLRFRSAYVGQEGKRVTEGFRIILNYEIPVL